MKIKKEKIKAARLTKDLAEEIERLIAIVPGLTWTSAINRGLELVIREMSGYRNMPGFYPVIESRPPGVDSRRTSTHRAGRSPRNRDLAAAHPRKG